MIFKTFKAELNPDHSCTGIFIIASYLALPVIPIIPLAFGHSPWNNYQWQVGQSPHLPPFLLPDVWSLQLTDNRENNMDTL